MLQAVVATVERRAGAIVEGLALSPARAAAFLIALVLALHLAGNMLLPPLDRTEVIYGATARQMIADGAWAAPRFEAEPKFEKPLAVLWLQALSSFVTGQSDQISGYRIPSLLGTLLAVLAVYFGARRAFGEREALLGAALLATMLVVTVQATLAMPEALMLAATSASMLALARMYTASDGDAPGFGVALLFWVALGLGMLVNVVTIPLIALLAIATLLVMDRGRIGWLGRSAPLAGIVIMLAIAMLWPLALWSGGTLEAAIAQWKSEGWHLLLGPQEMKWKVRPGLFVLFLLLGMFPAGLFLAPAMMTAWRGRATPQARFLVAWIVPYLLFLELFTRKTPLYMVQAMLPAGALLFAMWVVRGNDAAEHEKRGFRIGTYGWLVLVVVLVAALWALPLLLKLAVSPLAVLLGFAVIVAGVLTTAAMLSGQRLAAASALVVMAVAFNNLTIPVTFAGLKPVWVASEVRAAVDTLKACKPGNVALKGFNEPSAVFELGAGVRSRDTAVYSVWSAAEFEVWQQATSLGRIAGPGAVACVAAYDFIKGCSHRFTIFARGTPGAFARCPLPERYRCENVPKAPMVGAMCE